MAGDPKKALVEKVVDEFAERLAKRIAEREKLALPDKLTERLAKEKAAKEEADRLLRQEAEQRAARDAQERADKLAEQQRKEAIEAEQRAAAREEAKVAQAKRDAIEAENRAAAREEAKAAQAKRDAIEAENRAAAREDAKLAREKAAAEAAELARKQKVSQGNADFDRMSVKDKVTDGLAGSKNTHYTPEEFRDKLKMLKDELEDKGVLVTQRKFTHDIKATTDGRDVYSIEQRMLRGDKITVGEFDRYAKSKDKELKNAKAEEEALKKGTLQPHDTPIVKEGQNSPVVPVAHNSAVKGSALADVARQGLATLTAKAGALNPITEIKPALRHMKKTITAGVTAVFAAAGLAGWTEDNMYTLNLGERLIDSATGVFAPDPKDKDGKDLADVGLIRQAKFNAVLVEAKSNPNKWDDIRRRMASSSVDPELSKWFAHAMEQPAQPQTADAAIAEAAAKQAEKEADAVHQQAKESHRRAIDKQYEHGF